MSKTQIVTGGIADDAVSEEHLDATAITGSTELAAVPASTDELLISDAGTLKRIDFTHMANWSLLATTAVSSSSASVDFDGYFSATYHYYRIFLQSVEMSANDDFLSVQMKLSGGYQTGSTDYFSARYGRKSNGNNNSADVATGDYDSNRVSLNNGAAYFTNDKNINGYVDVWNPLDSHHSLVSAKILYDLNEDIGQIEVGGGLKSTSAVTGIRFIAESGATIDAGTFRIYGFK